MKKHFIAQLPDLYEQIITQLLEEVISKKKARQYLEIWISRNLVTLFYIN